MKNRKRMLNKYIGYTVTAKFLDGETYTGTLAPKQDECLKMSKELEEAELPKVKKVGDGIFCFEDDQGMVFMPKAKYEESEKKFKALEIIKEHRLDIDLFLQFITQNISYQHYVYCVEQSNNAFAKRFLLNKEEYELLKEILK